MSKLTLMVKECTSKDAGRGIVRMDPQSMHSLGIEPGGAVSIAGDRTTLAKAMPLYMEDRGKKLIQMDGHMRKNAKIGLDKTVVVEKPSIVPAQSITLLSDRMTSANSDGLRAIQHALEGMPMVAGDHIRVNVYGFSYETYEVKKTVPEGFVSVTRGTTIRVGDGKKSNRSHDVTYEDIGGLSEQTSKIREMIELPLKYPELLSRLGIEPPKGVLLYGPPGTGKTLIAKAIANETEAYFVSINGPEIIQKFYGESEANLRKVFDDAAKNAPSIIFIDELDAIAPKRGTVSGDVEKRVVTQLLTLMDGVQQRGRVIVIAATNMPELIDTALRRPGRFDREIQIGVPDLLGRKEILEIHTAGVPLADDVDLTVIAEACHGYVGADLSNLCREAAMHTIRNILPHIDFSKNGISSEMLRGLQVHMDDFRAAMMYIEPSAMREVYAETPKVSFADIGGLDRAKRLLKNRVKLPLLHPALYKKAGLAQSGGILLTGPPGVGKTMLVKALAFETGLNFIYVKGPELMSKWIGESEKGVRDVFKKARLASPCILFFDEIDSLAPVRTRTDSDSGVAERVVGQLLIELDGLTQNEGLIVIGATNRKDALDDALLRSGRIDTEIIIEPPNEDAAKEIFRIYCKKMPVTEDVQPESCLPATMHRTGAAIEKLCRSAATHAVDRYVKEKGDVRDVDPEDFTVQVIDFEKALAEERECDRWQN